MKNLLLFFVVFFAGCSLNNSDKFDYSKPWMPGYIDHRTLDNGKTQYLYLKPAHLEDISQGNEMLRLGLIWSSIFPQDSYGLLVEWLGEGEFLPQSNLKFFVDGYEISLKPGDIKNTGRTNPIGKTKEYELTDDQLKRIISAENTTLELHLSNQIWQQSIYPKTHDAKDLYKKAPFSFFLKASQKFLSKKYECCSQNQ